MSSLVILSLGSNTNNRKYFLHRAIELLPIYTFIRSAIYRTKALLPVHYCKAWDREFLNIVVVASTQLSPLALLSCIKTLEKASGRDNSLFWGPRQIDIDILFWNKEVIAIPELDIPHKQIHLRDFVLVPASSIIPQFTHITLHKTLFELLIQLKEINIISYNE